MSIGHLAADLAALRASAANTERQPWRDGLAHVSRLATNLAALDRQPTPGEIAGLVRLAKGATPAPEPEPTSPAVDVASVLSTWTTEGPMIHEATGIPRLDELTGGGPVYGSRWVLAGAPDAGKTALLMQLADTWLARGLAVGVLGVDEEPSDLVTRLMQRRGHTRSECEQRAREVMLRMHEDARALEHLRLYGPGVTIEAAAADLAAYAAARGMRAAFFADSLQTVTCAAEAAAQREMGAREAVTARMIALRSCATKHRLIALATSEVGRASYKPDGDRPDMAAAKESGAIEYQARVMLVLRSVPGEGDLLSLAIAKNKHGPSGETIGLRLDRRLMSLRQADLPEPEESTKKRNNEKAQLGRARCVAAAAALVIVLLREPGIARAQIVGPMRAELGECGTSLADAAVAMLGAAVVRRVVSERGKQALYLDGTTIPEAVMAALPASERPRAAAARPPLETPDATS